MGKDENIYVTCSRGAGGKSEILYPSIPGTTRIFRDDFCQVIKPVETGSFVFYYYWEASPIPSFIIGKVVSSMAEGLPKVRKAALGHKLSRDFSLFENAEIDLESPEWTDDSQKIEYESCLASGPKKLVEKGQFDIFIDIVSGGVKNATGNVEFSPKSASDSVREESLILEDIKEIYEKIEGERTLVKNKATKATTTTISTTTTLKVVKPSIEVLENNNQEELITIEDSGSGIDIQSKVDNQN